MSILVYVPFLLLFGAFVFGSVLARRGEKGWRTMTMMVGSIAQAAGVLFYMVGMGMVVGLYSGSSFGGGFEVWGIIMAVSGLLILAGMISFVIGFVTYCARAGAAGKRAGELEEMLIHLQQRIAEQDRILAERI